MNSLNKPQSRLQRTFCDLSQKEIADVERASTLARMGGADAFCWDKLLESKRILIISEAGAGKTYECRARQRALWDQGEPSFYLELAQLAAITDLQSLLSADEETRLDAWRTAQSDIATFFLDSLDELKLTQGSFEIALKRLSKAVHGQLGRVRIVITTRPIAVDQQLIQRHLPVPAPVELIGNGDAFADIAMGRKQRGASQEEKGTAPVWRNVALMPLSNEQIREMAAIEGIDDAEALLADVRARNAEDFARRPQDLIELCADWREHHRIRTHREQVAHNIDVKLKPRTDRREPAQLSPDKALEGASRLALAALLTRKLTIRLNVEADRGGKPGTALDPAAVLHDWTPEERETLLERSLFGFASYGRVRFHHRSVVEFLAAQHLGSLLSQGMPIKAIKRLLFAETSQGVKIVRTTMRPVAAWLAASQPSIFLEVRGREPEVLLNHGDPQSLPLPRRIDALRSYVQLYGKGGWRGLRTPQVQVYRFATPDLADDVLELWQEGIENHEVRELLLELIEAGPIPKCADIAHGVAINGAATHDERLNAIAALARLDDPRVELLTQSMVDVPALWPSPLIRGAVIGLFPQHIAPDRLCEILKRTPGAESTIDAFGWILPRNIAELDFAPGYLPALHKGLTDLVTEGLAREEAWPYLNSKHSHLIPVLAAVCLKLIRAGETNGDVLRSSSIVLSFVPNRPNDGPVKSLREELAKLESSLREATFWAYDAFIESLRPNTNSWGRLIQPLYYGPLNLNDAQDGAWVQRILADQDQPLRKRMMMLEALMRGAWDWIDNPQDHIEGLRQYVADRTELLDMINQRLAPREIDPDQARFEEQMAQQRETAERRAAEAHANWVRFWREVAEHPETAFSSDREVDTVCSLWKAMQQSGSESRASGWNRRFIERYFGKEVADRLRTCMQPIWRKNRPTLCYERPANERGTFLVRWQLGLAAIAAESEDSEWARKLSLEEAELAARYAPIELNGFPAWLEALAREHPTAVERTLGPDLTAELNNIAEPRSVAILLQNINYAPAAVTRLFLPRLRAWLDAHAISLHDSEDKESAFWRLESVLKILLEHGDDEMQDHIRSMAEDQLHNNGPLTRIWLTVLMRLDPAIGTNALERVLALHEPAVTGIAVDIFGIFGNRLDNLLVDLRRSDFTPTLLLRLVRLAYRYVRPCNDITHHEAYSPGPRDHAQTGRDAVLTAILNTKGSEAWAVKVEMAADPLFAHFHDRLVLLAREKAAEEADGSVFTESEVVKLNRYGEAPPMTRDDMFAMLVDRLDDLDDLLLQDVSPRAAWAMIRDEKVMRQQIALQLRSASNHAYTVDQEAVTADEKETDIRMRAVSGQQGTIELKLGENWSGCVLRDTIKKQLVTRYMAAESCRSGCLLVTVASDRNWQHPETGKMLDIKGLRAMLETEAARLIKEMGGCLQLTVKVLDLRPRLTAGE